MCAQIGGQTYTRAVPSRPPLLHAHRASVAYPGGRIGLRDVTVRVPASGITCLLGANGAGKTTLLEAATGLRATTSGTIEVLGRAAGSKANRSRVGVMLQDGGIPGSARPVDFLTYVSRLYTDPLDVDDVLERAGITDVARTPIRRLSGGEARRVAWAAAMIGRPDALVLDEPTAGLDPVGRSRLHEQLRDQAQSGSPMVISTHLIEDIEALADYIVVLHDGSVALEGTLDDLRPRNRIDLRAPSHLETSSLLDALPRDSVCDEPSPGHYRLFVGGEIDPTVVATVTSWCIQHGGTPDLAIADVNSVLLEAIAHGSPS